LQGLGLSSNQFTGQIPPEFGNLTNLGYLGLRGNHLTGSIPAQIGNLTKLYGLGLDDNMLEGPLPDQLGNLVGLEWCALGGNRFIGEVPLWIIGLVNLSWIDLGYNAFSSSDPAVLAFLASKDSDWQSSQTMPPANISATLQQNGDVTVSWSPIIFDWSDGRYEVGYSATAAGPYTCDSANVTSDKISSSVTITVLDLSQPVYFVVRTVSLSGWWNQSTLTSPLSSEFMLLPPASDKQAPDGSTITLSNMIVSAILPNAYAFYIEKEDRTWGIRVELEYFNLNLGQRINITGTLSTNADGERFIKDATYETGGDNPPPPPPLLESNPNGVMPLYMPNRNLGGGNWRYDSTTGAGQCGVDGGFGLNNIGLLVKTTGKVIFAGRDWLYIDDGSGLDDGSGIRGLYVYAPGYPTIPVDSEMWITGISSIDRYNGRIVNTLLAIDGGTISSSSPMNAVAASVSETEPEGCQ